MNFSMPPPPGTTKPRFFRERQCQECQDQFPHKETVHCDLCGQWFCERCYGSYHVWRCPGNER
jgi:hypothetical protein